MIKVRMKKIQTIEVPSENRLRFAWFLIGILVSVSASR